LGDSKVAQKQQDKRKSKRAINHLLGGPLTENFSQQGRKGHKERFSVSDLCGLCGLVVEISVVLFIFAALRLIPFL
jgi:hypothetical protein